MKNRRSFMVMYRNFRKKYNLPNPNGTKPTTTIAGNAASGGADGSSGAAVVETPVKKSCCASHRTVSEKNLALGQLGYSTRDALRAIRLLHVPLFTVRDGVSSPGAGCIILDGSRWDSRGADSVRVDAGKTNAAKSLEDLGSCKSSIPCKGAGDGGRLIGGLVL